MFVRPGLLAEIFFFVANSNDSFLLNLEFYRIKLIRILLE